MTAARPGDTAIAPGEAHALSALLGNVEQLIALGWKHSLWPFSLGLSCCYVDMAATLTPVQDLARVGAGVIRSSPRQADVLNVSGTMFLKMAAPPARLHAQMREPRSVIAMGACAISGGMYDVSSVVEGVDRFLPVDVRVPGCPPRPEALMDGLLLQQQIAAAPRPLGIRLPPAGRP